MSWSCVHRMATAGRASCPHQASRWPISPSIATPPTLRRSSGRHARQALPLTSTPKVCVAQRKRVSGSTTPTAICQVKAGVKTTPDSKLPLVQEQAPANARGSVTRAEAPFIRPRRMSHVLMFSPDVPRIIDFYNRALGLRLSDKSIDIIAFTHGPHGSDHHLVAFAKSNAKGWHHVAWDVARIDDVGIGAAQMAKAGYKEGWGTGRHVLGSNYFHYVRDPWGSFSEYSADIDYVPAGIDWPAGDFLPEDSLYLWGPDVPEYFIRNTDS